MPLRSSVCTYSPTTISNSKYSTVLPSTPGSLSVGNYKQLTSSGSSLTNKSSYGRSYNDSHGNSRINSSLSPFNVSSSSNTSSSLYSSPSSTSSTTSSSYGLYRPLGPAHSSFSSIRYLSNNYASPSSTRYSSTSSTGSSSSSSLGSAGSLLERSDATNGYSSRLNQYKPSTYSSRLSLLTSTASNEVLPPGVPRGLVNLGNTCYMNAVIQSLYSIESIRELVLRSSHDKILTSELSDLFKSMKNSQSSVNPSDFKYTFSRQQAKFSGLGQQDAQEFLRYLINGIHEEFNLAKKRPRRTTPTKPPTTADEAWSQYREIVDDSPLVDIVVGQLCSTIVCSICQKKSHCWDPFWDLSLPLSRDRSSCQLSDVVRDFNAKETLESDERPVCSSCKRPTRSTKQIDLYRLPQIMILHLKKFTNDGYKMTSPEVKIDQILKFNGKSYQLKACISHHGHSSSSGHYTSHCNYSSKWFHFNDDRVRDVTDIFDSVKLNDAYVLFYKIVQND